MTFQAQTVDIRRYQIAIFLVACATLILELSITRLFSVLMFYHFGFVAISMAMFGLGASGVFLYVFQQRARESKVGLYVGYCCGLAAISVVAAFIVILQIPVTLDYSLHNFLRLFVMYGVLAIPFFFSGLATSLILASHSLQVSRLYSWDLAGAASGAVATIPLLNALGGIGPGLVVAVLFGAASVVCGNAERRLVRVASVILTGGLLVLFAGNLDWHFLHLRFVKGAPVGNTAFEKWNAISYVTVKTPPGEPDAALIEIDADAGTYILRDPFQTFGVHRIRDEIAPQFISSIANELAGQGNVMIIGPGGGIDVVFALAWGAKRIEGVEINPIIVNDVMHGQFREFSGALYDRPDVSVAVAEGRSFIHRSQRRYDMIQLTLVDTWAATVAGAFSLSENNLYTTEAFCDYFNHLTEDGILAITRWNFPQPRETIRLMTTAFAAAQRLGVLHPEEHIIVIAAPLAGTGRELAAFIFKRSALTREDVTRIMDRLRLSNGRLLYSPFGRTNTPYDAFAYAPDRNQYIAAYPFNITPTTDDRPFFFNLTRTADLRRILALEPESRKNNLGMFNLYGVIVISLLLVLLFFIGPMVALHGRYRPDNPARRNRALLYFVAIGLGFILIEVALMQKFVLYLGHPIYALGIVLTGLLVSAGIGALASHRRKDAPGRYGAQAVFALLLIVIGIELALLPVLFRATLFLPLGVRIAISLLALSPLGFLLGHPFPLGITRLGIEDHTAVPWALGLNGAASVLGSVGAVGMAMAYGFNSVILAGFFCYVLAWGCYGFRPKQA